MEAQRLDSCRRDPMLFAKGPDGVTRRFHVFVTAPRSETPNASEQSSLTAFHHPDVEVTFHGGVPEPFFNLRLETCPDDSVGTQEMEFDIELSEERQGQLNDIQLEVTEVGNGNVESRMPVERDVDDDTGIITFSTHWT